MSAEVKERFQRREPWPQYAARHGRTTRTLDRWVEEGRIPPPEIINGRKYGNPDVAPKLDETPPANPQHRDPTRCSTAAE
jgi:hypothetical protein